MVVFGHSWDANGNMTGDGVKTYTWDAANRLTAIIYPGTPPATNGRTEFTYDGLGRRVKLVEKDENSSVQRTANFVWDGMTMAEERDSTGATVVKRFLPEGVQVPANASPNSKLYYSRDHLGSIRSLTNETGAMLSTLDYDAYGSISRAPVPANDTSGAGPTLTSAVSSMTHGSAGTFPVILPLTGAPGIEMRSASGAAGNYTLVLTFDRPVLAATSATIASGVGSVSGVPTFDPVNNTATVQLSGVADRQTITLELDNVVGVTGVTSKVFVAMSVCVGDVNQDGVVTSEDINLIRSHNFAALDSSTFKYDVNASGRIDGTDVSIGRQDSGGSLFPDFAFTGHYYHARSGLYFAPYRAYNPTIGRWLTRDPLGEQGGLNLYEYVFNNPPRWTDQLGLYLPPPVTLPPVVAPVSPLILPVIGAAVGLEIGKIPAVRNFFDNLFSKTIYGQHPERLKLCIYDCPGNVNVPPRVVQQSEPCPRVRIQHPDRAPGCLVDCEVTEVPLP